MATARRLADLEITQVDIVHLGANLDLPSGEGSRLMLFKSRGAGSVADGATIDVKQQARGASSDERPGMADNDPGVTSDDGAAADQATEAKSDDTVEAKAAPKSKRTPAQPAGDVVGEAIEAAVAKARADADQQIAAMKAQLDIASSALAEIKAQQIDKLFAEKAAVFSDVGDVDVIAELLKGAAARADATEFLPKVEQLFQATAARISESGKRGGNLYAELGTTASAKSGVSAGPVGELDAIIREIAAAKGVTYEAATIDAIQQRPDLYGQYIAARS